MPKFLYTFHEDLRQDIPNYADVSAVFERISKKLNEYHPSNFRGVTVELNNSQFHHHLLEMMEKELIHYENLSHIYAALPSIVLNSVSEDQLDNQLKSIKTFSNSLIYFPDYEVAITQIPVFRSDSEWPEFFYFTTSADKMMNFIEAVQEQLRQMLMETVTYLVDVHDGIKRRSYGEGKQITRDDVFLEPSLKQEIFRSIDEFFKEGGNFFKHYGLPYKRGILLYGSPGNGKTTLVKSITGSVTAPVVYWQITEHTSSESIEEVFRMVTSLAPAILVIEDIDSMPEYTRSLFLNTLDGAQSREGIFLIGTTNYPDRIDPALINRAGRFDRAYEIMNPTTEIRATYLRKLDIQHIFTEDELMDAAKISKELSMSQLNELYMSVALNWHYDKKLDYEKCIKDLQKQRKKAFRNEWERNEVNIGF